MPIFGGKQIAELQRRLAIGEQQYQEARGEIARLSEELVRLSGELTAAQAGQANLQMAVRRHGKQIRPLTMRARRSNRFAPNAQNKNRESVLIWSDL
jgi:hypothetical protein